MAQGWLEANGEIVPLIKPQFEAGRDRVGKKGVVRDPQVHREVLTDVLSFATSIGLGPRGLIRSPLVGPAGNVEFLVRLSAERAGVNIEGLIAGVLATDV